MHKKITSIPGKPGVYVFKDSSGSIIYVGKAKVLKNRVKSYFQNASDLDERKAEMVKNVADIEFTVTMNELEAFILEANLIKQHKPRYNILLRDDKSYPYIKLTLQEKWPRIEVVRKVKKDGARYFGPYVPAGAMRKTLSFIRQQYRIPDCRYDLKHRIRPCIQFQIDKCLGPCSGEVDHQDYMRIIKEVKMLLEGRNRALINKLEKKMASLSDNMRFEEAAVVRDRIKAIKAISEEQKIVTPNIKDADVIGLASLQDTAAFKTFFIRDGMIIGARHFIQKRSSGENSAYLLKNFIEQFYSRDIIPPSELLLQEMPEDAAIITEWLSHKKGAKIALSAPERGMKFKIVKMAAENAWEILKSANIDHDRDIAEDIAKLIGMKEAPQSIGAFDISNLTGTSAVGAFILWEDGRLNKSSYRHVRMDKIKGPDDYAMMKEMLRKTFEISDPDTKAGGKQATLLVPDLIIIDGGREHLNAALSAISGLSEMASKTIISIAKDPDRVFLQNIEQPIPIDDSRPVSLLLRRLRDEVHRFAITTHKKLRAKRSFESALDSIYGLGRKKRFALLEKFGSIDAIRKARPGEIAAIKGFTQKLASDVINALNASNKKNITTGSDSV